MDLKKYLNTVIHSLIFRIIIGVILITNCFNFFKNYNGGIFHADLFSDKLNIIISTFLSTIICVFVYIILFKLLDNRSISELSIKKLKKSLFFGITIGASLQILTVIIMFILGYYSLISINNINMSILSTLIIALSTAVIEELIFRGVIFRLIEEKIGTNFALILSSVLFGIAHLSNENSSLVVALGLMIQAGFLLGISYVFYRSLYFPIAIHFAWNFTQSGIFGASTSGVKGNGSLLISKIEGNIYFTGGTFGPEGTIQATLLCLFVASYLYWLSLKQNRIIYSKYRFFKNKSF